MDFSLNDDQRGLRDLARKLLKDSPSYSAVADAGLLGVPFSSDFGGAGMSFFDFCLVLEEFGRAAVNVPIVPSVVLAGLAIERFANNDVKADYLPRIIGGEVMTGAFYGPRATLKGKKLHGVIPYVPSLAEASIVLVPTESSVVAIDPKAASISEITLTNGERVGTLTLDGVEGVVLGDAAVVIPYVLDRARVALAAIQLGLSRGSLLMTARYCVERKQFGVPISSFQAVTQRAADAHIDCEAMELSMLSAAWRLSEGLPADREVAVAKYWASEGGHRVSAASQHLHGGIGFDCDYPLHRYTLWARTIEFTLGSAASELARLGQMLVKM